MSQSFINHRMFVAALNHDEAPAPAHLERNGASPARAANKQSVGSSSDSRVGGPKIAGVLLANALLHGYRPTAS